MDELGNILGVWAHPDDEAYLTAGIMARAVRGGSRAVCVTAARGRGGSAGAGKGAAPYTGEGGSGQARGSRRRLGAAAHARPDPSARLCPLQ